MKQLIEILNDWNGKQVNYLKQIHENYHIRPDFIPHLLKLLSTHPNVQKASTWLIKYHLEQKYALTTTQTTELIDICPILKDWEAQLHVLQMLPYLQLNDSLIEILEVFIEKLLDSPKKFVKAWTYNALYELTHYQPERKVDMLILFQAALETESAAVKARIRNLIKKIES